VVLLFDFVNPPHSCHVEEDIDDILARLEKGSPTITALMQPAVKEIKPTILYSQAANIKRPISYPLMLGSHHIHFKDGILVEVVKRRKHTDVLAAGGRYFKKNYVVLFDLYQTCIATMA
jgi:eukaryotic translation initiation factor 2-alpha kinase 4